jgi:hypothetical protein
MNKFLLEFPSYLPPPPNFLNVVLREKEEINSS